VRPRSVLVLKNHCIKQDSRMQVQKGGCIYLVFVVTGRRQASYRTQASYKTQAAVNV
jgi:hypothetical protein